MSFRDLPLLAGRAALPPVDPACDSCSRRTVLQGLAAAAAAALVGCGNEDPAMLPADAAADAAGNTGPRTTMCGNNLCIDLNDPANAALTSVDGAVKLRAQRILVVRTSDTSFQAVTEICTHEGCAVDYAAARKRIECPCHGSVFRVSGEVINGPAGSPLRRYTVSHDTATNVLTIML